ncbi:efflux transporter outer membrane subunit [Frateuria defendens]|uniref:efflux transporter outer membrane subunit n=1 Tax=Frateuria defendens TaxID=2219559 RepID=UPI00066FF3F0|nr:efflux transporter outer membrane subunit [Frateuria defendens]
MTRIASFRSAPLGLAAALAGCALAPPAKPPAPPSPVHYAAASTPAASAEADGVAQRFRLGARAVPAWWRLYRSDTLDGWVEEGLRHNPSLEASRHTLEAVQQQLRAQVGESLFPSVDAGGQVSRQRALGLPNLGRPTNIYNVYAGQLELGYDFDLFGANRYAVRQAAAQVDAQSYQLDAARRTLAANIVIAAVNASALAEQLAANERLAALAREQAALTASAYRLGAAAHEDELAAQQNAAAIEAALPSLRSRALRARHALAVLLGRTPDQAPAPLPLAALTLPAEVPVTVPSELLQQRPDVLAAEAAVHAASARVGVATANLFPRLSLSASLGSAAFDRAALFTGAGTVWSAAASLTQPIFHGGALLAQRKAAIADYQATLAQYQQTVLNAFQDVADTLTALDQDALALQAAQAGAAAAGQSFADTGARYRLGAAAYPMTVASEQRWQNARLTQIQATAARLVDTAALFQAMGSPQGDGVARRHDEAAAGRE